jgi:PQQ-like domain
VTSRKCSWLVAGIGAALFLAVVILPRMRGNERNRPSSGAADPANGSVRKVLWKFKSDNGGFTSIALGPDGTVYAGANNSLYALAPDGNLKWKTPVAGMLYLSMGEDGTVYATSSYGLGSGIANDGKMNWTAGMGMIGFGAPAAIGADGLVLYANTVSDLFAFEPRRSSSALWSQNTFREGIISQSSALPGRAKVGQIPSRNSPVIWRDETIVLARQHWLNYFNPDGAPGWVKELTLGQLGQPALADEGMIYVADDRHILYAVDRRGDTRWQYEADGTVNGSPVVGQDGTIYIATARTVEALGPDGSLKWKVGAPQQSTSSPAVAADGTLYIGGDAGLFALHPDGTEKWSLRAGTANGSPTIAADGTIYFTCGYLWVCATRDQGSPLAKSSWPKMFHDPTNSSRILTKF